MTLLPSIRALCIAAAVISDLAQALGTAWVSSEKDHAIPLIDMKTLAVTGSVATCKRPRHMQVAPGTQLLFVACADSSQADVIDLATRKSVRRMPLGDDPEAFDFSPDGKLIYVSLEDEGALGGEVRRLLGDADARSDMGRKALETTRALGGALERHVEWLNRYLRLSSPADGS